MHILSQRLNINKKQQLTRKLIPKQGIDLSTNDYLGFAQDNQIHKRFIQRINGFSSGASGSRLLGGHLALHEETEILLAQFVDRQSALVFSSGYQANIAILSALLTSEDIVFSDEYNHASIIDGIRLTKAKKVIFPHRDYQILKDHLLNYSRIHCLKIIISESLFSMDGTLADLHLLAELAQQYNALLIIDEAHSTGLWGTSLVATQKLTHNVFATIHTAGKALGAAGAWIAGNHLLKQYLINFARPFIFSTAVMPAQLILMQEAINRYNEIGNYRSKIILNRAKKLRKWLKFLITDQENTPIIPIIVNDNVTAIKLSKYLQKYHWYIWAIRPPAVPNNTARIRITVKWCNSLSQLHQFTSDLFQALENIKQ